MAMGADYHLFCNVRHKKTPCFNQVMIPDSNGRTVHCCLAVAEQLCGQIYLIIPCIVKELKSQFCRKIYLRRSRGSRYNNTDSIVLIIIFYDEKEMLS